MHSYVFVTHDKYVHIGKNKDTIILTYFVGAMYIFPLFFLLKNICNLILSANDFFYYLQLLNER